MKYKPTIEISLKKKKPAMEIIDTSSIFENQNKDPQLEILDSLIKKTEEEKQKRHVKKYQEIDAPVENNYDSYSYGRHNQEYDNHGHVYDEEKGKYMYQDEYIVDEPGSVEIDRDDDDFYEYRFNSSVKLLRELLRETNEFMTDAKEYLDTIKTSKRTSVQAITNQYANVNSFMKTKIDIAKEVTNINTKISDLEIKKIKKELKETKDGMTEMDDEHLAHVIFDKLSDTNIPVPEIPYSQSSAQDIDNRIMELEYSGENGISFTQNERAFKYEEKLRTGEIKICIIRTGKDWQFIAIDNDGNEIWDIPLPDKSLVGSISFEEDKRIGTDKLGNVYPLLYDE